MLPFESGIFLVLLLLRPAIDSRRSISIMEDNLLYSKSTDLVMNFMLNIHQHPVVFNRRWCSVV